MLTSASRVDWGSVPDWIAGIGSVLAFGAFGVAFLWEIRKRRQDDERAEEDRRDAMKRHARLVHLKITGGHSNQVRILVQNMGRGAIVDLETTLWCRDNGQLRSMPLDRRNPDATEVGAGSQAEIWLWLARGERLTDGQEILPQIEFTDCEGNRWRRTDNQQPVPA